jgi:1,4-dihydroxy-2-naphthoate polyprenyltransferase
MASPGQWLAAARPRTLPAAAAPVVLGTVVAAAHGGVRPGVAAATLAAALLIQVGTNLANDYFDARRGGDTPRRIGPTRITAAGLARPQAVLAAFVTCFAAALALGSWLLAVGGWPILLIGLSSLALGVLYTAVAWAGLADGLAFLYFGPVAVAGTAYLQTLDWPAAAWWAGAAAGGFSLALLTVNNYRDILEDARTGKRTLAVRLGPRWARRQYRLSLLPAVIAPPAMVLLHGEPLFWLAPGVLALVMLPALAGRLREEPAADPAFGARMNRLLADTGRLGLLYALLAAAGAWLQGG